MSLINQTLRKMQITRKISRSNIFLIGTQVARKLLGVARKRSTKRLKPARNLFRKNLQLKGAS